MELQERQAIINQFGEQFGSDFMCVMSHEAGVPPEGIANDDFWYGKMETKKQRHMCGLVNHPNDPGGLTKYGMTINSYGKGDANKILSLTLPDCVPLYWNGYAKHIRYEELSFPVSLVMLDIAVNSGPAGCIKMVQRALNLADDGVIGPMTMEAIKSREPKDLAKYLLAYRAGQYKRMVERNEELGVFLNGWLNRVEALRKECGV